MLQTFASLVNLFPGSEGRIEDNMQTIQEHQGIVRKTCHEALKVREKSLGPLGLCLAELRRRLVYTLHYPLDR